METQFAVTIQAILYTRTDIKAGASPLTSISSSKPHTKSQQTSIDNFSSTSPAMLLMDDNNDDNLFQSNRCLASPDILDSMSTVLPALEPDALPVHLHRHLGRGLISAARGGVALDNIPVVMKEADSDEADALVEEAAWYGVMQPILGDSIPTLYGMFRSKETETTALLLLDAGAALKSWCDLSAAQR
jgi:hypothetical protein